MNRLGNLAEARLIFPLAGNGARATSQWLLLLCTGLGSGCPPCFCGHEAAGGCCGVCPPFQAPFALQSILLLAAQLLRVVVCTVLFLRYTKKLELLAHPVLGAEPLWNLLHPGRSRTLLHRCLHRLLHHHKTLFVLPHLGEHAGLSAEPEGQDLVSNVFVFRVQCQRYCPKRVLLALCKAESAEKINWIKRSGRRVKLFATGLLQEWLGKEWGSSDLCDRPPPQPEMFFHQAERGCFF